MKIELTAAQVECAIESYLDKHVFGPQNQMGWALDELVIMSDGCAFCKVYTKGDSNDSNDH